MLKITNLGCVTSQKSKCLKILSILFMWLQWESQCLKRRVMRVNSQNVDSNISIQLMSVWHTCFPFSTLWLTTHSTKFSYYAVGTMHRTTSVRALFWLMIIAETLSGRARDETFQLAGWIQGNFHILLFELRMLLVLFSYSAYWILNVHVYTTHTHTHTHT